MTKANKLLILVALVAVAVLSAVFTIDEREKALVVRFGKIIRTNLEQGLHFKWPVVDEVKRFDARIQTLDADPEDYLTIEKKTLRVDSFVKWRVRNASEYWNKVQGDPNLAEIRLRQRVNKSLRDEFGNRTVKDVISGDRAKIMNIVKNTLDDEAQNIGVEVVDVRLKRVDLDASISERVYDRMKAERSRIATELRAQGAEAAQRIRANADRQSKIILAEADRDAETLRGEGDAAATTIYADAFGTDREFYNLYRSLNAYKQTFRDKSDLIILEPDSEFFQYFNQTKPPSTQPEAAVSDSQ